MPRVIALLWIVACTRPPTPIPPAPAETTDLRADAPPVELPPIGELLAIENVAPLVEDRGPTPDSIVHDCRLGPQLREQFRALTVRSCGALSRRSSFESRDAARQCVDRAIHRSEPFIVEQAIRGIDSEPARAMVGRMEDGHLVVYVATFDNGSCATPYCAGAGTVIERCARIAPANRERPVFEGIELRSECERSVADCFGCENPREVARCDLELTAGP